MAATTYADLVKEIDVSGDSTVSKTLYQDDRLKTVLFGFAPGQELSEHTASMPAIMHFLSGEARVTLGAEAIDARAGTWVHMPAALPHSIAAKTEVRMLLLLLKSGASGKAA